MTEIEPEAAPRWRTMYDSVNPLAIPATAEMVAGYVRPSRYAWTPAGFARFPGVPHVHITVAGSEPDAQLASVVDVEPGAFTASQARKFIRERDAFRPNTATVYCDRARLPGVLAACSGLSFWLWIADWIGHPPTAGDIAGLGLPSNVRLAVWQYENAPGFDLSSVVASGWHPSS